MTDDRIYQIQRLITDHVQSPALRHVRDGVMIQRLAGDILKAIERKNPIWTKWTPAREEVARTAAYCWIPAEDLRLYLNRLDGGPLTLTDVVQRLRAFNEEPYEPWPRDELREDCERIYAAENAQGTEMPAIVGAIRDFIEREVERRDQAHRQMLRERAEAEQAAAEARLRSGADCKWTTTGNPKIVHCRVNGRLYRLQQRPDKRFELLRITDIEATEGTIVGCYQGRGDATKAVQKVAYSDDMI